MKLAKFLRENGNNSEYVTLIFDEMYLQVRDIVARKLLALTKMEYVERSSVF